ncbi:MAG: hypothetical protein RMJ47_08125 [Bacteroidota bacterium]|nr:hypothetical protein [Bacteroidota bacterium]
MQEAQVLDVRLSSNPDAVDIATDDGVEPHRRTVADVDIPDDAYPCG